MKRALTLGLVLIATAVSAADLQLSTRHDELRALDVAPSRANSSRKVQWAPSGNFSALHTRAVFGSETETASRPYARENFKTAAGAGIFLSRDSFPGALTSPMSLHRFTYAHGNPMRYTDPSGRFVPFVILGGIIAWEALVIHNEVTTGQGLTESNDALNQRAMRHFESEGIGALSSDASGVDTAAALTTTTGGQFATGAFFGLPNLVLHPMKAAESAVRIPERFIGGAGKVITGHGGESARLEGLGEMGGAFGEAALVATAVRGGMQGPSGITSTGLWAELGRAAPTASVAAESFSLGTAVMNELQPYNPSVASMRPPWMPREASYTTKLINGDFIEVPEGLPVPGLSRPVGTGALSERAGVYHATGGGQQYTGSATNLKSRVLDPSHTKMRTLLECSDCTLETRSVDLGAAKSRRQQDHVLRFFEREEMEARGNTPQEGTSLNSNWPTAAGKKIIRKQEVDELGATSAPDTTRIK